MSLFYFNTNNTTSFSVHLALSRMRPYVRLQLGGVGKPFLSLIEVNDAPDGVEVLLAYQTITHRQIWESTHVSLDIEILKVEGMLPDIDANNGNVAQERILVSSGDNLQAFGGRVQALHKHIIIRKHQDDP